jgi:hypothetical protein
MKIFKFGGASVKDATSIQNVVSIIAEFSKEDRIFVVVSAIGKTTNFLETIVKQILSDATEAKRLMQNLIDTHKTLAIELFEGKEDAALFQEFEKQPIIIYSYEDCEIGSNYIYKRLSKFDTVEEPIHISTLVALDDNESTFSKNKDNALHIPAYEPEFTYEGILEDERALLNVMFWLTAPEVINIADIRKVDKSNFFDEPNIKYENLSEFMKIIGLTPERELEYESEEDNEIISLSPKKLKIR